MCFFGATKSRQVKLTLLSGLPSTTLSSELPSTPLVWVEEPQTRCTSKRQRPHDKYRARKQQVRRFDRNIDGEDNIAGRLGQRQPLAPFLSSPPTTDDGDSTSHSMRPSVIDTHQHHSLPSLGEINNTLHQVASDIAITPGTGSEIQTDLHDSLSEGDGLQERFISSEPRTTIRRDSWVNEGILIFQTGIHFYCLSTSSPDNIATATVRDNGRLLGSGYLEPFSVIFILMVMWPLAVKHMGFLLARFGN